MARKINQTSIIDIDRTKPFDPIPFPGEVAPGFLSGEFWSIGKQDKRSLRLTTLDISNIHLETCKTAFKNRLVGMKILAYYSDNGYTLLDAKILQFFWENKNLVPRSWKRKRGPFNTPYIFFPGTVFEEKRGGHVIACLHWYNGKLYRGIGLFEDTRFIHHSLIVLAVLQPDSFPVLPRILPG